MANLGIFFTIYGRFVLSFLLLGSLILNLVLSTSTAFIYEIPPRSLSGSGLSYYPHTMKIQSSPVVLIACLLLAGSSHAQTVVDFNDLTNTADITGNLLDAGDGIGTNLTITRTVESIGGADQYLFNISYDGKDYDGGGNDTFSFDLRVAGMAGNSYSNSALTASGAGTSSGTDGAVTLDGSSANVTTFGGADNSFGVTGNMDPGDTLIFTVENLFVGAAGYGATFDGFNAAQGNESVGHSHTVIIGTGSDLDEIEFNNNANLSMNPADLALYLTGGLQINHSQRQNWGARLIDFDFTVLQNFIFDGSTDSDWATVDNWSTGVSPNTADARVAFDGDNGTQTTADLAGGTFTIGELQVVDPATAVAIQSSAISSVLTLSPSAVGVVMTEATKDFTLDGTTGEAWTLALGNSQFWNIDSTEAAGDLIGDSGVTLDLGANTVTTNVGVGRELSLAGVVTGAGGITKTGVGTIILSGTNTYTGATTVNAGTVQVGSAQALGVNSNTKVSNGLLKLDGNSITVGGLSGAGTNDGSDAVVNDNASAVTLTVGGGDASGSFGGVIADGAAGGALSLTKTGTGTQTLSGSNSYTGATTISAGTLQLDGAGTVGTGDTVNDGTLVINKTAAYSYAGDISGTGALTKSNTGTQTLSGASTYTGATTVNAGTLNLTGSLTSAVTVADGATLSGNGSTTGLLTLGDGSGTGVTLDVSAGVLSVEGLTTNVTGGNVSVNFSGTGVVDVITYGAGSGLFTGLLSDFTAASPLGGHGTAGTFSDDGTTISLDTGVSGSNVWIGTTDGTWEIGGSNANWQNSYADGLFYENDLIVFNDTGIAQPNVTLTSSVSVGSMTLANTSGTYVINDNGGGETITLSSGITSTATGDVTINALVAGTGGISHTGSGTLTFGGDNTLTGDIVNDGSLVFNQSGTSTYADDISGTGSLAFSGTGTTTLSGTNTYSGGTTLSDGRLNVNNSDAVGTGTITLNGGTMYESGGTVTLANDIVVTGTTAVQASGGGNFTLSGAITGVGTLNFGGVAPPSSVLISDNLDGFTGTIAHENVSGDNNLTFPNAVDTTAKISSSGNTGGDRTFSFNGGAKIGELSGAGGRIRSGGLLLVDQDTDSNYAGSLENTASAMSLEKQGSGILTLSGPNTYTGTTTATEGTLVLRKESTQINRNWVTNSPATLEFNIIDGADNIAGTFNLSGNGIFKKTGADDFSHNSSGSVWAFGSGGLVHVQEGLYNFGGATPGVTSANLGDLQLDSGASFEGRSTTIYIDALNGSGTMGIGGEVANGGLILGVDDGSGTFSGVIQNTSADGAAFSLEKTGTGTQTLSGVNTYTGDTTVSAGTLTLADGGSLTFVPAADTVTNQIGGSGILNLDGEIYLDLSGADTTDLNSWLIVDVTSLTETFGGTFTVNSSLGGFTNDAGVWTFVDGAYEWTFSQSSGVLSLGLTPFGAWATAESATLDPAANDDADTLVNLLEFAFGTDPLVSDANALTVVGGTFTAGTPAVDIAYDPLDVKARFIRLVDHANSGITYTAQFTNSLTDPWEDVDGATATIISGVPASGGYEAVEIDYPLFLGSGKKARFFRLSISEVNSGAVEP